jgi:hypothetical protein
MVVSSIVHFLAVAWSASTWLQNLRPTLSIIQVTRCRQAGILYSDAGTIGVARPSGFFATFKGVIMAGTLPEAAEIDTLTDMIASLLNNWFMRLLKNTVTLNASTTLATLLANEATFTGYSPSALTTWTGPTIDGTTAAISVNAQGLFTPTSGGGSGNLFGYFLTNAGGTKLYAAELFSGTLSTPNGISLEVDTTYSLITRF